MGPICCVKITISEGVENYTLVAITTYAVDGKTTDEFIFSCGGVGSITNIEMPWLGPRKSLKYPHWEAGEEMQCLGFRMCVNKIGPSSFDLDPCFKSRQPEVREVPPRLAEVKALWLIIILDPEGIEENSPSGF